MNGKKAKALRRIARDHTEGKPNLIQEEFKIPVGLHKENYSNQIRISLQCTRGWYRLLKKAVKAKDPLANTDIQVSYLRQELEHEIKI